MKPIPIPLFVTNMPNQSVGEFRPMILFLCDPQKINRTPYLRSSSLFDELLVTLYKNQYETFTQLTNLCGKQFIFHLQINQWDRSYKQQGNGDGIMGRPGSNAWEHTAATVLAGIPLASEKIYSLRPKLLASNEEPCNFRIEK